MSDPNIDLPALRLVRTPEDSLTTRVAPGLQEIAETAAVVASFGREIDTLLRDQQYLPAILLTERLAEIDGPAALEYMRYIDPQIPTQNQDSSVAGGILRGKSNRTLRRLNDLYSNQQSLL